MMARLKSSQPVWFDPQCRADDAEVAAAIADFAKHLERREIELATRSRTRTVAAKRSFCLAVEVVCCNLLLSRMLAHDLPLAVPLAHGMMWSGGRYNNPVYGKHFLNLIELLTKLRLIERLGTGYRFSSKLKAPSLVKATASFAGHFPLDKFGWHSIRREPDPEVIVLKSGKDEDGKSVTVEYRESKSTRSRRAQVVRINKWLGAAQIEVLPDPSSSNVGDDGFLTASYRRSLHRTFNNGNWQHGGRLWGGFWMSMRREDRFRRIRINGEPIADIDYEQLYPSLAYARARSEMPDGDIYNVVGDGSSRDGWKMLINAMLFAERPLGNWPKDVQKDFPKGMRLKEAVTLIERAHAPIAGLFGTGLGFELMRIESDMLITIVTNLFKMSISALPLHDAVLVARSHAEAAKEAMQHEFAFRTHSRRASVKIDLSPI